MKFKFMHAADIHLDSPLRGLERYEQAPIAEVRGASRAAFERLIKDCIEQSVDFLLLAGDLYDGDWKDYNTGLFLLRQMGRLRDAGIKVYIVRGNHDAENAMTKALRPLENMHVCRSDKPQTFPLEHLNVAIHGQSYDRYDTSEDLSLSYPAPVPGAFNIGLLHTSADGSAREHKPYAPCSIQALGEKGYDYWALGHVHKRKVMKTDPYIVFPGNLQGRHVQETGAKGATLVTVDDGRVTLEHRDLDVMRWFVREVPVDAAGTASHAIDLVHADLSALREKERGKPLAVRVSLRGSTAAHSELVGDRERWINEIRGRGGEMDAIWVEKVQFETRTPTDLDSLRQRPTALGELLRTIAAHRADEQALAMLVTELQPLRDKLANAHESAIIDFDNPAVLRGMLDDIEQMLIPMLLDTGDST